MNLLSNLPKNFKAENKEDCHTKGIRILGYEPYFDKLVSVATIYADTKEIKPSHGYYAPHKYGKQMKKFAQSIGYNFNND